MSHVHLRPLTWGGRGLLLAALLVAPACSLISKHSFSTAGSPASESGAGDGTGASAAAATDDDATLDAERAARTQRAIAARDAFFAKDCATLQPGDFDALIAAYDRSPARLSIDDRVRIATEFVACKRDVELFEKVAADVSWDAFVEKFPKSDAWLARLQAYVSSESARFPDSDWNGSTVSNLWLWVKIAQRDGMSEGLCKAAFAHRANLAPLSAGAPLAFACANAGNAKAVATLVPGLLGSEDWQARVDGCAVLALVPSAASRKVAKVVRELSYGDSYQVVIEDSDGGIDEISYPVQETCAAASRRIELAH